MIHRLQDPQQDSQCQWDHCVAPLHLCASTLQGFQFKSEQKGIDTVPLFLNLNLTFFFYLDTKALGQRPYAQSCDPTLHTIRLTPPLTYVLGLSIGCCPAWLRPAQRCLTSILVMEVAFTYQAFTPLALFHLTSSFLLVSPTSSSYLLCPS